MSLELLSPICKREKSDQHRFSTGGVPPCSRCGCRQTLHQRFPFLVGLCLLSTQVTYSSLPVLPLRQGGDAPGVDLMASLTDVQLLTSHPGCNQSNLLECLPSKDRRGKHSSPERLCTTLSLFLTAVRPMQT